MVQGHHGAATVNGERPGRDATVRRCERSSAEGACSPHASLRTPNMLDGKALVTQRSVSQETRLSVDSTRPFEHKGGRHVEELVASMCV